MPRKPPLNSCLDCGDEIPISATHQFCKKCRTMEKAWQIIKIQWVRMCPKCYAKQIPCVGMDNNDNWKGTLIGNRCFEMFSSEEAIYRTPEQFDNISRAWTPNRPWEDVE